MNNNETMLNSDAYFVWGAGLAGKRFVDFISRYTTIKAIIDNDATKQGQAYKQIPIVSFEKVADQTKNTPIICAVQRRAKEVTAKLDSLGIPNMRDLFFTTAFMYHKYNKIYIEDVDMCLTTKCYLNCEHCNSYLSYYENRDDSDLGTVIQTIDHLFHHVDYIQDVALSGGDPLMHTHFSEIFTHIADNYLDRIENISIMTTGLMPRSERLDEILSLLAKYKGKGVRVSLSAYTEILPQISNARKNFIDAVVEVGADYYKNSNATVWYDFGDPNVDLGETEQQVSEKFYNCTCSFSVHDGKLYRCSAQRNAKVLIPDLNEIENNDYFDLSQIRNESSELNLLHMVTGMPKLGYLTFCRRCKGFFNVEVPPAIQKERK